MATVIEIIEEHLVSNGFDGLINFADDCGCLCGDLASCNLDYSFWEPAYKGADENGTPGGWAIYSTKELAKKSFEQQLTSS